jgi:CRP/FNR family transcriptional regulator
MVGPGRTFGEVAAIGDFACPAFAEAIVPTRCVLLPLDPFRRQMAEDHQLCLEMMTGLSFWVRHLIALMEDLVLRDAAGRLARFLLESEPAADGTVTLPSLKRHVASHLNLTSETFSRTLGRFIEAGLVVELENNRVQIRDRDRLRDVTDGMFPEL